MGEFITSRECSRVHDELNDRMGRMEKKLDKLIDSVSKEGWKLSGKIITWAISLLSLAGVIILGIMQLKK